MVLRSYPDVEGPILGSDTALDGHRSFGTLTVTAEVRTVAGTLMVQPSKRSGTSAGTMMGTALGPYLHEGPTLHGPVVNQSHRGTIATSVLTGYPLRVV